MKLRFSPWVAHAALLLGASLPLAAQAGAKWRHYGGDLGNTHYSPLDQINPFSR
jgi:glucose dehydrogenase